MADNAGYRTIAAEGMDEFSGKAPGLSAGLRRWPPRGGRGLHQPGQGRLLGRQPQCLRLYILREARQGGTATTENPRGPAACRCWEVLQSEGLTDVVAVVTVIWRHSAGRRGWSRAYSHGAKIAVDAAPVRYMEPCRCSGWRWSTASTARSPTFFPIQRRHPGRRFRRGGDHDPADEKQPAPCLSQRSSPS